MLNTRNDGCGIAGLVRKLEACVTVVVMLVMSAVAAGQESAAGNTDDIAFFEQQIAPILERRCYACHSHASGRAKGGLVLDSRHGWKTGGSGGAAVVPGKPDDSLLMEAVRYESFQMPPDEQLRADEIALLEQWIAMGAPDPRESQFPQIDPESLWALKPISTPAVPAVQNADWPRDALDHFILARLEEAGLNPAGDADRYTLLRRLTFDLTGLPPTPDEIEAFVSDSSENACEKVVDRLLQSPGFGDHWARHWFDLSCYADLTDIQGNVLIRDAWRYRDYVIAAHNADKPLDRFIHEQIAGDLLPADSDEQRREHIIATGFLAIGPWTLQNYIKGQLDADVVDHQINRIGRTFLAQTISCARCHDHKFDPVPTRDYYALAGIFHSTLTTSYDGPGVWSQIHEEPLPELPGAAAAFEKLSRDYREQQQQLRKERSALRRHDEQLRCSSKAVSDQANSLTLIAGISANDEGRRYRVAFAVGPSVWSAAGQATSAEDGLLLQMLRPDETVLAYHVHRPGEWSGKSNAQQLNEVSFEYTGDGSGDVRLHITASEYTGRFGGAIDDLKVSDTETSRVVFAEDFEQCQFGGITGTQADTGLTVYAQCSIPGWTGGGINHSHVVAVSHAGAKGEAAEREAEEGQGQGGLAGRMPAPRWETALQIFSGPPAASDNPRIAEINDQLERLDRKLDQARPDGKRALAVRDVTQPADTPVYVRGDFQSPGDVVARGFLSAVPVAEEYDIPENTSGRLQLAHWLTDPRQPLTSRVLANRIWHHLFGTGLVRTVDYFGVHGETPSHPKLLDFLARRLTEEDQWSLKRTIRRIVLSRTYQMAATHSAVAAERDPDNRWLWHMPRRRLTAESIRDAMLAVSGQLDAGRGGPSLGLELEGNIQGLGGEVNPPTWAGQIAADIRNRRSVYLPLRRERPLGDLEILSVFDFPHPNDITGARPHTTIPTQALFLLNAPFVKQQAGMLAERVGAEQPGDERAQINRLYLLTIGRPATTDELETAVAFLDDCAKDLARDAAGASDSAQPKSGDQLRSAALTELCHAVLGSNSFLFRE